MRPNFEGAHLWMGEHEDGSGVQTAAALRLHVAEELKKEAAIDKERRKAREVKDAARDARAKAKASPQGPPGK
eukprot:4192085-Amphidinium_carterae.1